MAFERAFRSPWLVDIILLAAILSLVSVSNATFIAASRLLFALGGGQLRPRPNEDSAGSSRSLYGL